MVGIATTSGSFELQSGIAEAEMPAKSLHRQKTASRAGDQGALGEHLAQTASRVEDQCQIKTVFPKVVASKKPTSNYSAIINKVLLQRAF